MVVTAVVLVFIALAHTVSASLPFTVSYPRQCTPLNVTWTPTPNGYPYSVYILGIGSDVQSWRVDKSYQPNANQITFQYVVPKPSPMFNNFMVAIADSQGNGNSSGALPVNTGDDAPQDCDVYAASSAFYYASDSVDGQPNDRQQCGSLKYYPVHQPYSGTTPFSLTLVPLGSTPVTVDIPKSATRGLSYFVYTSTLPFKAGTQFYQFMSDATGGGSGGGSPIYTVGSSANTSCLASGYQLSDQNMTNAMPVGSQTASFQNLAGAIASAPSNKSGSGNKHGSLIGGIIGAVIGVGAILVIIAGYLVYRKREKRKRELERKEQPQFIDLDDDELDSTGRRRVGVQQSYSVSPFTYQPAPLASPQHAAEAMPYHDRDLMPAAAFSQNSLRPMSTTTSEFNASIRDSHHNDGAAGMYGDYTQSTGGVRYPPASPAATPFLPPPSTWHPSQAQQTRPTYGMGRAGSGDFHNVYSSDHLASGSGGTSSSGPFGASAAVTGEFDNVDTSSPGASETARWPPRSMLDSETEEHVRSPGRWVQHEDAGPIVDEVPPSYASWAHHTSSTSKQ